MSEILTIQVPLQSWWQLHLAFAAPGSFISNPFDCHFHSITVFGNQSITLVPKLTRIEHFQLSVHRNIIPKQWQNWIPVSKELFVRVDKGDMLASDYWELGVGPIFGVPILEEVPEFYLLHPKLNNDLF